MNLLHRIFISAILLFASSTGYSQQKPAIPIDTVVERVQAYFSSYPIEKVHLHFDKPYYAVGDTLWFKTYLNNNLTEFMPSKIVYVEVLNSRDSLIQTLRIKVENQVGKGQLVLDPQFWSQDNYRFRAYTKWMMNFKQDYFFNKIVPIGDAINKKLGAVVNFVPEGNRTKATIQFRDKSGALLGRRKLTWEANDGWDAFDKGKGETDDMGRLTVNLTAKNKELMKNGKLVISIENNSERLVGQYSLSTAFWDADVQFFPEGGDLIAGLSKKVAFKAVSNDGRSAQIKGKIIDSKKREVVSFEDFGIGMGHFSFIPEFGEKYKALVTFDNKNEKIFDLPDVVENAVNLVGVKQDETHLQIGVVTSEANFQKINETSYYILGHGKGHLVYAAQVSLKNSSVLIKVPKENLPNGIVEFTLFTRDGVPISSRKLFCNSTIDPVLDIQVQVDKENYTQKELVKLGLNVKNGGQIFPGSYSVSVIDESKVPSDDDRDLSILSNMLLVSDLQGFIDKPNYYFNTENANREEALDALLMTQGFTRFSYKELLQKKYPQVDPRLLPEQGISMSGTLRLNTGRTHANGGLVLSIPAAAIRKDAYTDKNGRFSFDNLVFPDSSKVTVNARGNDNFRALVINMDQTFFPEIDKNSPYKGDYVTNIDENLKTYLANSKNEFRTSILIDEVVISKTVEKKQTSRDFSALTGLSMPEHRIENDRLSGCNTLSMCLSTVLTGITYDSNTLLYYVTRSYNQGGRVPVQFFLNGMPIDVHSLNSIQPSEIEAIEIFLRDELGTISRTYQNDGVVSIITKKEDFSKKPRVSLAELEALLPKTNVLEMYPLGYVRTKQFYVPKYDTPASKSQADYRTTVYWNPDVNIDETGQTMIDFYNADGVGRYKIVVEGVDNTGAFGRKVLYYNVR